MKGEPELWLHNTVRVKEWKWYDVGIQVEMHKIVK